MALAVDGFVEDCVKEVSFEGFLGGDCFEELVGECASGFEFNGSSENKFFGLWSILVVRKSGAYYLTMN